MPQLHFHQFSPSCVRVKLGAELIGNIVTTKDHAYRFVPLGGAGGVLYPTLDACKASLAPLASTEWAEGLQILREWRVFSPALVLHAGRWHVFSRSALLSSGGSIDEALAAGGFLPRRKDPRIPVYVAVDDTVRLDDRLIAEAGSKTLAKRIAAALNEYIPGDRGF